eukprot:4712214-Prymnesium_polylepis.1
MSRGSGEGARTGSNVQGEWGGGAHRKQCSPSGRRAWTMALARGRLRAGWRWRGGRAAARP